MIKLKNLIAFCLFVLAVLLGSCSKSSNSSSTSNSQNSTYSNWTISNSPISQDNDYFNSHPLGSNSPVYSEFSWSSNFNYFMGNGYVENNSGDVLKLTYALIKFASKPAVSGSYRIGNKNNLGASECYF